MLNVGVSIKRQTEFELCSIVIATPPGVHVERLFLPINQINRFNVKLKINVKHK